MTIYYDGTFARITDETFESRLQGGQTFAIRELEHPHAVRPTSARPSPVAMASFLATAAVSAGLVVIGEREERAPATPAVSNAGVIGWVSDALWPAALWVASLATLLAIIAIVARLAAARRRPMELRALYRGSVVTLLSTRDPLVLGQVSRALLRVIELGDDHSGDALGSDWATVY